MEKIKKELAKNHSENMVNHLSEKYKEMVDHAPEPEAKVDFDTPFWKDSKEWDEVDKRRGNYYGRIVGPTIVSLPSRRFKERFDMIDWNQ
jgi:hypothetical protein